MQASMSPIVSSMPPTPRLKCSPHSLKWVSFSSPQNQSFAEYAGFLSVTASKTFSSFTFH
jgi:hypothetical protein